MNKSKTEEDKIQKAWFTRPVFPEIVSIDINRQNIPFCAGGLLNEISGYVSRFSI